MWTLRKSKRKQACRCRRKGFKDEGSTGSDYGRTEWGYSSVRACVHRRRERVLQEGGFHHLAMIL